MSKVVIGFSDTVLTKVVSLSWMTGVTTTRVEKLEISNPKEFRYRIWTLLLGTPAMTVA